MSRWWAPSGAHVGPDDTDLQRLQPGEDKRLDLGQYLLTVHRMGAAACEETANGPIPNEFSFIEGLAAARAVFAAPVVEAVSKSLGDHTYADLLVRDVLDDAEQGALAVFRTAVSGGVPAAIAAQRAGMVYGCPPDALGAFLPVAKELRAHPAALTDAADRALFTAVEKAVLEEMDALEPEYEEVSKAPALLERQAVMARPDQLTTPYYDARDIKGRFAAPTQTSIATVLAQAPVGQKAEAPSLARTQRVQRVRRQQRQKRQQVTTQRQQATATSVGQAQMAQSTMTQAQVEQKVMEAFKIKPPRTPTGGSKGRGEWPDNLMDRVNDQPPYERLADAGELHIALNQTDWNEMRARMGEGEMFRIGHVVRRMGAGSVQKPGAAFEENISELASQFFIDTGHEGADIKVIPQKTLEQWEINGRKDENLQKEIKNLVDEHVVTRLGMTPDDPDYDVQREVAEQEIKFHSFTDPEDNRVLVHEFPNARNAPLVDLVIPREGSYAVRASHGPDSGPGDIDLDPNQVYRVETTIPNPNILPKYGAVTRQYAILPVSDDELEARGISKAEAAVMARPDLLTTPYYDARDIKGRFTAAPVSIVEELAARTKVEPSVQRQARTQRMTRPQRQATQQTQMQSTQLKQGTMRQATVQQVKAKAKAIQQAKAKAAPEGQKSGPGFRDISPTQSYAALTPAQFAALVGGGDGPLSDDQVAAIVGGNMPGRAGYGDMGAVGRLLYGEELHGDLFDIDEEHGGTPDKYKWEKISTPYPLTMISEYKSQGTGDPDLVREDQNAIEVNARALRLLANIMFEDDPRMTRLKLVKRGENEEVVAFRDQRDFVTAEHADPIVLVEIDEDLLPTKPAVIEVVQETRKNRLIPPRNAKVAEEVDSPDLYVEPSTTSGSESHDDITFRNPVVRLYRMKNVEDATNGTMSGYRGTINTKTGEKNIERW